MKKSLVALATLAAATGAFAQSPNARAGAGSNVEIFGVIDMAAIKINANGAGGITRLDGSGRNESSRLGFRGVEDLGGGKAAAFWLEMGMNFADGTGQNTTVNNTSAGDRFAMTQTTTPVVPTGTLNARQGLTFNRASTVSLIDKDLGELRVGRDYNPTFWNMTVFDPFGTVGVGSAVNVIGGPLAPLGIQAFPPGAAYPLVRTSNSIGWLSQNMNGFRAQVQYALSQQGTDCVTPNTAVNGNTCWGANGDGKLMAYRLTYTSGPLTLAAASSTTQYGNVATNAAPNIAGATGPAFANTAAYRGDYTVTNFAAAYVMGATRFTFQSGNQTNEATAGNAPERKLSNTHLGVAHTMGATTLKASINTAKRSDGAAIGTNGEDGAKAKQIAVGAVYDLSKRTALYGTYSKADLTAGPVTGGALRANLAWAGPALAANASNSAKGIDIGIRHRF